MNCLSGSFRGIVTGEREYLKLQYLGGTFKSNLKKTHTFVTKLLLNIPTQILRHLLVIKITYS